MVKSLKTLSFAWFSSLLTMLRICAFHSFFVLFFGYVFANLSQIPCFRLLCMMILGVRCEVFVWKASKHEGFCMVDVSKMKQQEAATRASQSNRQRLRSNAKKETEDTSRIRMDVITPPPTPCPPPPPPRAELNASLSGHVQKVESRQKHRKNRCEMRHTHTQTPKKTMRNGELSMFLYSAARRLLQFCARKHRKNRCENKTQVQLRVSKAPKLEFQHMPAKKSHNPARRQTHVLPTTTTTTPATATATATTTTTITTRETSKN